MRPSRQTSLLARTFFRRLFESDLMPPGLPQVQLVMGVLAFFAAPALLLPFFLVKKYVWIRDEALLRAAIAQDRTMALLLCMVATAMVTLAIWETLFPDRRDSRHLGVLPVPNRSFIVARLAALCALFALVFLATTALLSVTLGLVTTLFAGGFLPAVVARHFIVIGGAEGFVFFGIVALHCAVLTAAGPRTARQLTLLVQLVLVVAVMQIFIALPPREAFLPLAGGPPAWTGMPLARLLPPLWFSALYDCMASSCGGMQSLATLAASAAVLTPLAALLMYALSYGRLTRLAIEGGPLPRRRRAGSRLSRVVSWLAARATRSPVAAAVCVFTLRTLSRSRQHRMLLAGWIGLALALIVSSVLPLLGRFVESGLPRPHPTVLAAPLILAALTLAGMRMLIALPAEIKANWTFRLREPGKIAEAVDGVAAALGLVGVLPAVLLAAVSAGWLWGVVPGLQHALFCALMGMIAVEALMRGVDKVPFTCTYCPGKARVGKLWPAYLTAFSLFTYFSAFLESGLLRSPSAYGSITAALGLGLIGLVWLRHRRATQLVSLRFEEEPLDTLTVVAL